MPQARTPWQRRLRRLLFVAGAASTFYYVLSYALDRMREARLKAQKERRERDLIKNHFTSLISTLSFTLYALLPTLQPQIVDAYPVENTSRALQGLSSNNLNSSLASLDTSTGATSETGNSLLLHGEGGSPSQSHAGRVGESWASEFERREQDTVSGSESGDVAGSAVHVEADDAVSSTLSQSISLPPTDTSSFSPSPSSDMSHSQLHSSPTHSLPRQSSESPPRSADLSAKSKKELWKDLKVQTLTRTITTAYLVPLLYLLTTSQLAILARTRYLADVKAKLDATSETEAVVPETKSKKPSSWFSSFSVSSLALHDFIDPTASSIVPNPLNLLPTAISSRIPSIPFASHLPSIPFISRSTATPTSPASMMASVLEARAEKDEADQAEAERVFLSYSWWILHEGWRGIAQRVEDAVREKCGGLALKRELSVTDWEKLIREIRAEVETTSAGSVSLYDFTPHLIPPTPLPQTHSTEPCPLPSTPISQSSHLVDLLNQTQQHLNSQDGRYLIDKAISAMIHNLISNLSIDVYSSGSDLEFPPTVLGARVEEEKTRRLVDCLPGIDRWGKGVWEGIPDNGVEAVLAVKEFEGFAALIFGDWAPRDR